MPELPTGQDLIRGYGARLPASRLSAATRWLREGGPAPSSNLGTRRSHFPLHCTLRALRTVDVA